MEFSTNFDGDLRRPNRILTIFGDIGETDGSGTTALEVSLRVIELVQDDHTPIYVLINSPGGSVMDGLSMLDAFDMARTNGCKVVTRCQGQAQSMAADLLVLGGDYRSISYNSVVMVHGDWSKELSFGDAIDIDSETRARSIYTNRLLDLYEQKTKKDRKFWAKIFRDSRPVYYTPQEALSAGLVDVIF
jgi:ATP-dependent Clp protease protease subunit